MLSWILSLFSGGFFNNISTTINNITKAISDEKIAQINATSDVEKTQISAKIDQLQSQRDVLIANSNSGIGWIDEIIRFGLAVPLIAYVNKLVLYDKVIGSWGTYSTDGLGTTELTVLSAILGYLFLYSAMKIFK